MIRYTYKYIFLYLQWREDWWDAQGKWKPQWRRNKRWPEPKWEFLGGIWRRLPRRSGCFLLSRSSLIFSGDWYFSWEDEHIKFVVGSRTIYIIIIAPIIVATKNLSKFLVNTLNVTLNHKSHFGPSSLTQ